MKCINKKCNNRINITKKFKYWRKVICKCNILYYVYNSKNSSNVSIEATYHFNKDLIIKLSLNELGSSKKNIKNKHNVFEEYKDINNFIFNGKNIHKVLKNDFNFCIRYIDNLIFQ
jgi:hypothetical protein